MVGEQGAGGAHGHDRSCACGASTLRALGTAAVEVTRFHFRECPATRVVFRLGQRPSRVLLAALVATSTLAPFLPVANAGVIAVRRSDESGPSASATVEAAPAATVSKEKKMVVAPLPASIGHPSSSKGKDEKHSKKGKGKKNNHGRVCPTFS